MTTHQLLEIDNLSVYHEAKDGTVQAVDGASLMVGNNEAVALVGESGSGKTTLGLAVMRLIWPPTRVVSGRVLFKGRDLVGISESELESLRRTEVAMVFQDPTAYLNPLLRIELQISEAIPSSTLSDAEVTSRVREVLNLVKIADPDRVMRSFPHQLSGGMKQRVMLAMSLVRNPKLIILDEPTSALDVTIQFEILKLLKELKEKEDVSFLFITHDLPVAASFCDRIYVMYAGKIAEYGSTAEMFARPSHPYTKLLLASSLRVDQDQSEIAEIPGTPPDLRSPPIGCRFAPRCPYAFDRCTKEPPLFMVSETHAAACWLEENASG